MGDVNPSAQGPLSLVFEWKIAGSQMIHQSKSCRPVMCQLTLRSNIEAKQECSGLESDREIGQQLDKEFRAGKLDSVNCQGVPTDEAKRTGYLIWRLEAALATCE